MEICEKHNCVACCLNAEVPLLNEDVNRIMMHGYYDVYFVNEQDGVKTIRKFSQGTCVFYKPKDGSCEIYDFRPEICQLRPYTVKEGTHEPMIDESCEHASECKPDPKLEEQMKDFFDTLLKEIEWRRNTGYLY